MSKETAMGDHSKPDSVGRVRAALTFLKGHRRAVMAFVAGGVAAVSAVKPNFPGAAVLSVVHALLGA
jgi:hypothetical protein